MTGQTDVRLVGSYWTLAAGAYPHTDREYCPFDFRERIEIAARAGFRGFGIWHADLEHILERYPLADVKRILDDNGIEHVELEFIYDWFTEGEKRKKSDRLRRLLLDAAEALGASHVKVGDFFKTPCPMPRLVETFAALCREAREHGTRILFEMMPFACIDTLEDSIALVEEAGEDSGGLILDLWHVVRMDIPYEALRRIPPGRLMGVELNDGMLKVEGDLHLATVNDRRFCGEGEFDVRGFIATLKDMGYRGPWGIEVLNETVREWPLARIAEHAFATTAAQFGPA